MRTACLRRSLTLWIWPKTPQHFLYIFPLFYHFILLSIILGHHLKDQLVFLLFFTKNFKLSYLSAHIYCHLMQVFALDLLFLVFIFNGYLKCALAVLLCSSNHNTNTCTCALSRHFPLLTRMRLGLSPVAHGCWCEA